MRRPGECRIASCLRASLATLQGTEIDLRQDSRDEAPTNTALPSHLATPTTRTGPATSQRPRQILETAPGTRHGAPEIPTMAEEEDRMLPEAGDMARENRETANSRGATRIEIGSGGTPSIEGPPRRCALVRGHRRQRIIARPETRGTYREGIST